MLILIFNRQSGTTPPVPAAPRPISLPAELGGAALRATATNSTLPAKQDSLPLGAN